MIGVRTALGVAWGVLAALPLLARARRADLSGRLGSRVRGPLERAGRTRRVRVAARRVFDATGPVARVLRGLAGRRRTHAEDRALEEALPVALDLLGVAVGAGCTPYLAVEVAARWIPGPLGGVLAGVPRACALGAPFGAVLDGVAAARPRLRPLADALLASERLGAPVGPALARLADEERAALRRRAETRARQVPVRLLFPLVFLVLPAFLLLTVVPGLASGLARL